MTSLEFGSFVSEVCSALQHISDTSPEVIAACKNGEDFEACVVRVVQDTLGALETCAIVHYTPGSHVFPDIVVEFPDGAKYGIEVKSSSSPNSKHWKINGNSVLGSTKEDVLDTYIIFGKTHLKNQGFRCRRYEDAVANVAVTHSPRYAIDMEISPDETFFARSGLTYQQISESPEPISLITNYFKSQGQRAWWLAESTPAAIRTFATLPVQERNRLLGYCFAHFPEVFSSSASKFSRCAMWLATEQSIVSSSLRDNFSAGGKFEYPGFGRISRIYATLGICKENIKEALDEATIEELYADWGEEYHPEYEDFDKFKEWLRVAANCCPPQCETGYQSLHLLRQLMK